MPGLLNLLGSAATQAKEVGYQIDVLLKDIPKVTALKDEIAATGKEAKRTQADIEAENKAAEAARKAEEARKAAAPIGKGTFEMGPGTFGGQTIQEGFSATEGYQWVPWGEALTPAQKIAVGAGDTSAGAADRQKLADALKELSDRIDKYSGDTNEYFSKLMTTEIPYLEQGATSAASANAMLTTIIGTFLPGIMQQLADPKTPLEMRKLLEQLEQYVLSGQLKIDRLAQIVTDSSKKSEAEAKRIQDQANAANNEFDKWMQEIRDRMNAVNGKIDKAATKADVTTATQATTTKVTDKVTQVQNEVKTVGEHVTAGLTGVKQSVNNVGTSIQIIAAAQNEALGKLANGQEAIATTVDEISSDVKKIGSTVTKIDSNVETVNVNIGQISSDVASVQASISEVQRNMETGPLNQNVQEQLILSIEKMFESGRAKGTELQAQMLQQLRDMLRGLQEIIGSLGDTASDETKRLADELERWILAHEGG